MRSLYLALTISALTFLSEWLLDTIISVNMYRLYRDVMIGLLVIHFWDLYAEKEAERLLSKVEDGIEKVGHELKEELS